MPGSGQGGDGGPVVLIAALALGGPGAVAQRARADLRAGALNGVLTVGVTDALSAPQAGTDVRTALPRSTLGIPPSPLGELAAVAAVARTLRRAAAELRPHSIVFHSSTLAWPAIRIARAAGARSVFVVHALIADRLAQGPSPYNAATTLLYTRANRFALRRADRVVCVSEYMAGVAARGGAPPERLRVLSNAVALDEFSPGEEHKTIDVLFAGRLSGEKGVDTLLLAAHRLQGRRVVIAGDGPAADELRGLAARIGVDASFAGSRSSAQIAALMRQARLLVVPSRSEPQGVVVLEALATGLPVVASRVGGIPELIDEGHTGWLVAPDDPDALADAIVAALSDSRRLTEMGRQARAAAQAFGPDALAEGFAGAYL